MSNAAGLVEFKTIYPGWYRGRAVHIHLKVHVNGAQRHTGQLFFDDTLTDKVFTTAPYPAKRARDTRNTRGLHLRERGRVRRSQR